MLIPKLVQKLSDSIDFSKAMTIFSSLLSVQVFQPFSSHNKRKSPGQNSSPSLVDLENCPFCSFCNNIYVLPSSCLPAETFFKLHKPSTSVFASYFLGHWQFALPSSEVSSISPRLSQSAVPRAEALCSSWGLLDANWSGRTCLFIQPSGVFGFSAVLWCSLFCSVCCLFSLQLFLVNLLPHQSACILSFCPWLSLVRWSRNLSKVTFI